MARVMVFGGTGFVGSHAVRACVERGHEVVVGTIAGPEPQLLGDVADRVEFVPGDLRHWPELLSSLRRSTPDVVVNCAGFASGDAGLMNSATKSPSRAVDVNIVGFMNLLDAVVAFEIPRLVWTSSSTVFGSASMYQGGSVDEDAPYRPASVYGATKAFGEALIQHYRQQYDVESVALRLPFVYGPDRWYGGQWTEIRELFEAAASGRETHIDCPETPMDLVYAPDAGRAVEACVSAAELPGDIYNVVGHRASIPELADAIRVVRPDVSIQLEFKDPPRTLPQMNDENIHRELGFKPEFDVTAAARHYLEALAEGS